MDIVTLDYPIEVGDEKVKKIALRRPTLDDLEVFEEGRTGMRKLRALLKEIASFPDNPDLPVTAKVLGKLDAADLTKVSKKVMGFLPQDLPIGESE